MDFFNFIKQDSINREGLHHSYNLDRDVRTELLLVSKRKAIQVDFVYCIKEDSANREGLLTPKLILI